MKGGASHCTAPGRLRLCCSKKPSLLGRIGCRFRASTKPEPRTVSTQRRHSEAQWRTCHSVRVAVRDATRTALVVWVGVTERKRRPREAQAASCRGRGQEIKGSPREPASAKLRQRAQQQTPPGAARDQAWNAPRTAIAGGPWGRRAEEAASRSTRPSDPAISTWAPGPALQAHSGFTSWHA